MTRVAETIAKPTATSMQPNGFINPTASSDGFSLVQEFLQSLCWSRQHLQAYLFSSQASLPLFLSNFRFVLVVLSSTPFYLLSCSPWHVYLEISFLHSCYIIKLQLVFRYLFLPGNAPPVSWPDDVRGISHLQSLGVSFC